MDAFSDADGRLPESLSKLLLKPVRNFPSMTSNTDYGRPMKPFFIETPGFKEDVVVAGKDGNTEAELPL